MIIPLVTLDYARSHANTLPFQDLELEAKLALATLIVMNHCKLTEIPQEWIVLDVPAELADINIINLPDNFEASPPASPPVTRYAIVPGNITAAILLVMSELFENREASTSNPISTAVEALLASYRDPSFA